MNVLFKVVGASWLSMFELAAGTEAGLDAIAVACNCPSEIWPITAGFEAFGMAPLLVAEEPEEAVSVAVTGQMVCCKLVSSSSENEEKLAYSVESNSLGHNSG